MTPAFWSAESWTKRPALNLVVIGVLLGVSLFVLERAGRWAARSAMVVLEPEEQVLDTLVEAGGGGDVGEVKARAVVAVDWPGECDEETSDESVRRLAASVYCITARGGEDADAKRARFLTAAEMTEAGLAKAIGRIGKDDKAFEQSLYSMESWCEVSDAWQEHGVDSDVCAEHLNAAVAYPASAKAILSALLDLDLKSDAFREAAQEYAGAEDDPAWGTFVGGVIVQPHGPHRPEIQQWASLPPKGASEPLRLAELHALARRAVALDEAEEKAAELVGEAVRASGYARFTSTIRGAASALLFFLTIMVLWAVVRRTSGWRRVLAAVATVLVVAGMIAPSALSGLGLSSAKEAIGNPDGVASILGAPFAVIAQLLDLVRAAIMALDDAVTQQRLLIAALFGGLFFARRPVAAAAAAYAILLSPRWFETLEFTIWPWDLDALEVAWGLPIVGWMAEAVGFVLAAFVVRGAWRALGAPLVEHGVRTLTADAAEEPAAPVAQENAASE